MFACRTRNEKRRLNLKSLRRYAPGIYFCVCSCRYSNKIFHKMLVFQQKTYYFQYIYIYSSKPYGKRHTSRTEPVLVQAKYIRFNITFTPIVVVQVPDQVDAFFNPKNASEKDAKNITPPSIGQLEKRTSFRATDV